MASSIVVRLLLITIQVVRLDVSEPFISLQNEAARFSTASNSTSVSSTLSASVGFPCFGMSQILYIDTYQLDEVVKFLKAIEDMLLWSLTAFVVLFLEVFLFRGIVHPVYLVEMW